MKTWKYTLVFLLLALTTLSIAAFQLPDGNLHIIACNVGQGDAILITYKSIQILTDGGPDKKVLNCLGKYLPFYDREIELVISSHPDADHLTGLTDVVKNYKVDKILINPVEPGTDIYRVLESGVGSRGIGVIRPQKGMVLGLDLIHLDIVSRFDPTARVTNVNSIVYKLKFGRFLALFPGDIPQNISDGLAGALGQVNYIKIPHHGSKNGLTENLLKTLMPKIAVISVGKNNLWRFPAPEITDMLKKYGVETLRTDQMGSVEVVTDGSKYWVKGVQKN